MENDKEQINEGMDENNKSNNTRLYWWIGAGVGIALAAAGIVSNIKADRAFHEFMKNQRYVTCVESIDKMTWTIPKNEELGDMEHYLIFDKHNSSPDDDWFLAKENGFFKVKGVEIKQECWGAYAPACYKVPKLGENYTLEKICSP